MANLIENLNTLESNLQKLLKSYAVLQQENQHLEEQIENGQSNYKLLQDELAEVKKQNQSLKTANAMLGSKEYKRDTKLKINSLIREIDQCIVQLSE